MKKMTGVEYKQFMAADWDALFGLTEAYVDGQEITVDGAPEPDDMATIADTATVVITGGCIMARQEVNLSFELAFTRWKKLQTHTTLVVQVPNADVQALRDYVKTLNGKVLQ